MEKLLSLKLKNFYIIVEDSANYYTRLLIIKQVSFLLLPHIEFSCKVTICSDK